MAIRTVILDDSLICRMRLREILEQGGEIEVVGEASSGDRVLELIDRTKPKVLLVDLEMPGVAGHATIERVMANRPLPILVVTGLPAGTRQAEVFESIRRGALELAAKPTSGDTRAEANLRQQVKQLSTVPVVRHVAGNLTRPSNITQLKPNAAATPGTPRVIGIGASAGGPLAMATVLAALPNPCRAAVVVVQHLPVGFTKAFAEFLRGRITAPVRIVENEARLEPGVVFVAPDDRHLTVSRSVLRATDAPPVEGHRPAVDVLFHSLAELGPRAAGVILSGMGCDGVSGLGAMRRAGAITVAQSQDTCGVFGMPAAALSRGAAQYTLSPLDIAALLGNWTNDHPPARVN